MKTTTGPSRRVEPMREGRRRGGLPFFIGIDLAGSPLRKTGVAVLAGEAPCTLAELVVLRADEEILSTVRRYRPGVVAIDAPLTPSSRGYRRVDVEAKRLGFRLLPPSWRGMRMLTERGMRLAEILEEEGYTVVETHPRSALISAGCQPEGWTECIEWCVHPVPRALAETHLVDALVSACVAYQYHRGVARVVSAEDGEIVLLSPWSRGSPP